MPMNQESVERNIWTLYAATKETRERCVAAEAQVKVLEKQVTMMRTEIDALRAIANAAIGMAQGGVRTA